MKNTMRKEGEKRINKIRQIAETIAAAHTHTSVRYKLSNETYFNAQITTGKKSKLNNNKSVKFNTLLALCKSVKKQKNYIKNKINIQYMERRLVLNKKIKLILMVPQWVQERLYGLNAFCRAPTILYNKNLRFNYIKLVEKYILQRKGVLFEDLKNKSENFWSYRDI